MLAMHSRRRSGVPLAALLLGGEAQLQVPGCNCFGPVLVPCMPACSLPAASSCCPPLLFSLEIINSSLLSSASHWVGWWPSTGPHQRTHLLRRGHCRVYSMPVSVPVHTTHTDTRTLKQM